ncbi:hypothetical protein B0J14DRAFT_341472 [Halenospora varia]|nr:hypothetical protein B0J14DRAFT_341472 [Halenospora varia]
MNGYAKIANLMGHHSELAIFRRFGRLNFQNILYLQAKLTHLEKDLERLVRDDEDEPGREFYSKDWWSLANKTENDCEKQQWEKVLEIRETLEEYNEQLTRVSFLTGLGQPKAYDLEFLHKWLERPKMGNFPLRGPDQHSWSAEYTHDLLAIARRESSDPFSRWLSDSFIPFFHNILGKKFKNSLAEDPESGIGQYSEKHLSAAVNILGTVMASVLPIVSIVVLYFVTSTVVRLGLTIVFTGLFSCALALMTRARRVEIFTASSA